MRLRQIKLAGFKSFVDPTQIDVPGRLVGVVGPNGCGKSNVIDAVRWVLGETKAAELRGESMQDVIFNGAANRKPAGRASVELVFDNSSGRLAGEWGRYAELSVKRILTRDNTSAYLINNQQVRRRDVHDLFMGTGLGPRAYAIIGQGMISRIVEARPEELRVFLEEAAGVTKYKERRKETEARLGDTRDNLARVGDILRELEGQVGRLEQQAEVARHYRDLQERHGRSQALLWLTRLEEAQATQGRIAGDIAGAENAIEAQIAELRTIELQVEEARGAQYAANDAANAAHADLSRIHGEVGRLETEIRGTLESRARWSAQIETQSAARDRRQQEQVQLGERHAELAELIEGSGLRAQEAEAMAQALEDAIPDLEGAGDAARDALTAARSRAAAHSQEIAGAGQQMQMVERALDGLLMRRERLEEERRQLGRPDDARLAHLQTELGDAQGLLEASLTRGEEAEQRSQTLQEQREQAAQARSQAAGELQRSEARHHAVQETLASMEADERLDPWLREQGMQSLPRFFARVEIESGWETALEAVLRERVEALEVGRLEGMGGLGRAAPPARVSFFTAAAPAGGGAAAGAAAAPNTRPWRPLLEFTTARPGADTASVQSVLADWLAGTFVQADLDTALAQRGQLAPGEQFVVAGGHLVSRHGLRFFAADDRKSGLLARKREAEHLERQIRAQRLIEEQATETLARLDSQLRQAQQVAGTEREASGRLRTRAHELQIETVRLSETLARIRQRGGQIDDELSELAREEAEHAERRALAEARFGELDEGLGQVQELAEVAREADERAQALLREGRERARVAHAEGQRLAFEVTALRNRQADLAHAMGVAREDAELSAAQVENATLELARLDDSAARSGLEHWLGERVRAEQAVAGARAAVDAALARGRSAEEQRQKIERGLQPRRDRVTELRLQEQASRLASEQHAASLAEAGADIDALRPQLAGAGSPAAQESLIGRLAQEIRDLGAVNLAALQELETARERQGFLQSQSGDLQSAVTTLEDAIRKIDQETRALLQGTFDAVNRSFGEMFPRLFGGGEARLTMTGEEILDAGVQVTAQPPGKRNSSIHLLSGGEKALTATALVFALFKLNPAPFCLLDEVDAPLDDANTERFCQLVQSMADATQFLFISHNKIAMEIAEQLIGVTMQEQGVSRIVAVDIDGARRLAADAPTAQAA